MSQPSAPPPRMKPTTAHLHEECVVADDCNGKGWCFGQACEVTVPERPGGGQRRASGRCATCRRRIRNREQALKYADPTMRHPEGM